MLCARDAILKLGSRQIQPKKALCVHVLVDTDLDVGVEDCGARDVMMPVVSGLWLSRHPPNHPRVEQWCDTAGGFGETVDEGGSRQSPNQPGWWQEELEGTGVGDEVGVTVIGGAGVALADEVADVVVVESLHPNQPGVLHVEVEVELVIDVEDVVVVVVVVVSSRHPHQPGVLQVEVRVRVVVLVDEEEVVESDPLLSKYFQLKQSTHSLSGTHSGGLSYLRMILSITLWILWLPMPTRQPRSLTVS
jgi:hypothetical protein